MVLVWLALVAVRRTAATAMRKRRRRRQWFAIAGARDISGKGS
jgi:hypothetical protein